MAKKQEYGNESIKSLKGADRVRKRPAVIFGSDGVEGCAHSIFEIVSNSIDEARDGYGNKINVTLFEDHSVEVEDFGRGIPVDYNKAEQRWNWDLVFCELYAGGKYGEGSGTFYFMNSDELKAFLDYKKSGKYEGITLQLMNEDPQSTIGRQTVTLYHVILATVPVAYLDDSSEDPITFDSDFTFDDVDCLEQFMLPENYR